MKTRDSWSLPTDRHAAAFVHLSAARDSIAAHEHADFQLVLPIRGTLTLSSAETSCAIAPPDAALIWPRLRHAMLQPSTPVEAFTVLLHEEAITKGSVLLGYALRRPPAGIVPLSRVDVVLRELVIRLASAPPPVGGATPMFQLTYEYLCAALVDHLHREEATQVRDLLGRQTFASEYVARAVEILRRELAHAPSLSELSRRTGTSSRNLTRCFAHELGMTPKQYTAKLRIQAAMQRLVTTDASLEAIAAELGYASVSHFSRTFRTLEGSTPGSWREQARRNPRLGGGDR